MLKKMTKQVKITCSMEKAPHWSGCNALTHRSSLKGSIWYASPEGLLGNLTSSSWKIDNRESYVSGSQGRFARHCKALILASGLVNRFMSMPMRPSWCADKLACSNRNSTQACWTPGICTSNNKNHSRYGSSWWLAYSHVLASYAEPGSRRML